MALAKLDVKCRRMKLEPQLSPYKNQLEINQIYQRSEIMMLLEENVVKHFEASVQRMNSGKNPEIEGNKGKAKQIDLFSFLH